jgi:tetratricopeptide (TPR) repeat protein
MFRELEQPFAEAWALSQLGSIEELEGALEVARDRFEQALAITRDPGMATLRGVILAELADNSLARGDVERARSHMRDAVEFERHGGDLYNLAGDFTSAAWIEVVAGDLGAARRFLIDAFQGGLEIEDTWQLSEALIVLAVVLLEEGRPDDARRAVAATGWDKEPPPGLMELERSLTAQAFTRLQPLLGSADDPSADAGRHAGLMVTVRSFFDGTTLR